jgi:pilus assembly protein TadC
VDTNIVIGILALAIAAGAGMVLVYTYFFSTPRADYRALMGSVVDVPDVTPLGTPVNKERQREVTSPQDLEKLKKESKKRMKKKQKLSLEERFFQAGIFSEKEKRAFHQQRFFSPIVLCPLFFAGAWQFGGVDMGVLGAILGVLIGVQLPFTLLDKRIQYRAEEIMFYLPLVIEQIAIGVSSSLDIGPCLQRVVQMADERDTHNVVTELVRHAQFFVKSGASLEEAMTEVGRLSGHTELKHAFMSLAQVAKHGGEITRQLQELADAVSMQRETKIEERIKKLELEATGPVALVFVGFMIILLIGFGIQIQGAF